MQIPVRPISRKGPVALSVGFTRPPRPRRELGNKPSSRLEFDILCPSFGRLLVGALRPEPDRVGGSRNDRTTDERPDVRGPVSTSDRRAPEDLINVISRVLEQRADVEHIRTQPEPGSGTTSIETGQFR